VLFLVIVGRLASPELFRSRAFALRAFWMLIVYSFFTLIIKWSNGSYMPGGPISDGIWHIGAHIYYFGTLLPALFALSLPYWLKEGRWIELTGALASAIFMLAFVIQHRAGIVALAAVLLVAFVLCAYFSKSVCLRFLGVLTIISGLTVLMWRIAPEIHDLVKRADSYRFEIWVKNFSEWERCGLWIGCGPNFESALTMDNGMPLFFPHNLFLSLGLYSGMLCLVLFCILYVYTLYKAWRNLDPWGGFLIAGLAELFFNGGRIIGHPSVIWVFTLLPMALIFNPWGQQKIRG
jgi:hypothetical protein